MSRWRVTQGTLGAKLRLALLPDESPRGAEPRSEPVYSWRFAPDASPCLSLISLRRPGPASPPTSCSACSSRRARRAMRSFASQPLESFAIHCSASAMAMTAHAPAARSSRMQPHCNRGSARLSHLTRAFTALRELRVPAWPMRGPSGFASAPTCTSSMGGATSEPPETTPRFTRALETRAGAFSYASVPPACETLPKLPERRIVMLATRPRRKLRRGTSAQSQREAAFPPSAE